MTHYFWTWTRRGDGSAYSLTFNEIVRYANPDKQILVFRWNTGQPWKVLP